MRTKLFWSHAGLCMQIYWLINEHICDKKKILVVWYRNNASITLNAIIAIQFSYHTCNVILRILQHTKSVNNSEVLCQPAGPRRTNNVILTSKRSRFDVAIALSLCRVTVGQAYMARFNFVFLDNRALQGHTIGMSKRLMCNFRLY